jgi:hypothetical protein
MVMDHREKYSARSVFGDRKINTQVPPLARTTQIKNMATPHVARDMKQLQPLYVAGRM